MFLRAQPLHPQRRGQSRAPQAATRPRAHQTPRRCDDQTPSCCAGGARRGGKKGGRGGGGVDGFSVVARVDRIDEVRFVDVLNGVN